MQTTTLLEPVLLTCYSEETLRTLLGKIMLKNSNRFLVTGCAGFIGSSLVDRLLKLNQEVKGIDNFSTGRREFLSNAMDSDKFSLLEGDIQDVDFCLRVVKDVDFVFHFAANADVRFGSKFPRLDLEQNTIATHNILEAMRINGIKNLGFSSTGSVYGEASTFPTPENSEFPVQTSLYGASKLAAEGMIAAYCEAYSFKSYIFRFVSILGPRYTHGHVYDFCKKLQSNPNELHVLGDGRQKKSYLHIEDCLSAIIDVISFCDEKVNIYNLGLPEYCELNDSISWITKRLNCKPAIKYSGGKRGWVGDNPFILLDVRKLQALGWQPNFSIRDGVEATIDFLVNNQQILKAV